MLQFVAVVVLPDGEGEIQLARRSQEILVLHEDLVEEPVVGIIVDARENDERDGSVDDDPDRDRDFPVFLRSIHDFSIDRFEDPQVQKGLALAFDLVFQFPDIVEFLSLVVADEPSHDAFTRSSGDFDLVPVDDIDRRAELRNEENPHKDE